MGWVVLCCLFLAGFFGMLKFSCFCILAIKHMSQTFIVFKVLNTDTLGTWGWVVSMGICTDRSLLPKHTLNRLQEKSSIRFQHAQNWHNAISKAFPSLHDPLLLFRNQQLMYPWQLWMCCSSSEQTWSNVCKTGMGIKGQGFKSSICSNLTPYSVDYYSIAESFYRELQMF